MSDKERLLAVATMLLDGDGHLRPLDDDLAKVERDCPWKPAADKWRLAQAQTLLTAFERFYGRPATSAQELDEFMAAVESARQTAGGG